MLSPTPPQAPLLSKNIHNVIDNPRTFADFSSFKQTGTSPLEIWYPLGVYGSAAFGGLGFTTGNLRAVPFTSGAGNIMDIIAVDCTATGVNAKARCGIYDSTSGKNLYPNNLIVDSGEFDMSTLGVKSASISTKLKPNQLYWAVLLNGTASSSIRAISNIVGKGSFTIPFPNTMGTANSTGLTVAQAYGALPSVFTAGAVVATTSPMIFARFSS